MSVADQTYLLAIARILREGVAPQVAPGYGRLALLACRHMLLRLAHPTAAAAELPPLPLDQLPADATHIKLLTGGPETHATLAAVVGRISIEVLPDQGPKV